MNEFLPMDLGPLVRLTHRRWNIPVLAALQRGHGAKFVTLVNGLQVSRSALTTTLNDLVGQGLVARNTGYGHPLRPEYLLTAQGERIAAPCLQLAELLAEREEEDLAYRKWTLPLVAAVGNETRRFNEVRSTIGVGATARAVTLGLKSLLARRWAQRLVIDDYPPATGYELLPDGKLVLGCLRPLLQ